jgi:hypothetical protein
MAAAHGSPPQRLLAARPLPTRRRLRHAPASAGVGNAPQAALT